RVRRPVNPFTDAGTDAGSVAASAKRRTARTTSSGNRGCGGASRLKPVATERIEDGEKTQAARTKPEPVVTRSDYDRLQEKLTTTEEILEDVLAEAAED